MWTSGYALQKKSEMGSLWLAEQRRCKKNHFHLSSPGVLLPSDEVKVNNVRLTSLPLPDSVLLQQQSIIASNPPQRLMCAYMIITCWCVRRFPQCSDHTARTHEVISASISDRCPAEAWELKLKLLLISMATAQGSLPGFGHCSIMKMTRWLCC